MDGSHVGVTPGVSLPDFAHIRKTSQLGCE